MRYLSASWKRHRRREEIPDEQAKLIHCMNKSLTARFFMKIVFDGTDSILP